MSQRANNSKGFDSESNGEGRRGKQKFKKNRGKLTNESHAKADYNKNRSHVLKYHTKARTRQYLKG